MNERQTNTMATIVNMNKWRFSGYRAEEFQYYPHQEHWKETTTQKKISSFTILFAANVISDE